MPKTTPPDITANTLAARLCLRRTELGLSQQKLAENIGTSQQAIERIERGLTQSPRKLLLLARSLHVTPEWLLNGLGPAPSTPANTPTASLEPVGVRARKYVAQQDLPVLGRARGGPEGNMVMESDPIDWTYRPAPLEGVEDAFAVFVTGDSMEPRYMAGDLLYVHPKKPVRHGRHVLVETRNHAGMIKRFDRWSETHLHLWQYNPAEAIILNRADVLRVMLVIGVLEG